MPDYLDFPPLPKPTSAEEKRAALLSEDPRALALLLSGESALREAGRASMEDRRAREQMAERQAEQRFGQEMAGTKELRERAQLHLLRQQLQQGAVEFTQDLAGRPMLFDRRTRTLIPVPLGGGSIGAPGAPLTPLSPRGSPAAPVASGGPAGARTAPPPAWMPTPGLGAAPGPLSISPGGLREPSEEELVAANLRKHLPAGVQKELDTAEKSLGILRRAAGAVATHPDAFGLGENLGDLVGTGAVGRVLTAVQTAHRSPEKQAARAAVYTHAVAVIHELAGAQQSQNEATRILSFTPAENDPPEQIMAKLTNAYEAARENIGRNYRSYMPLLNPPAMPNLPGIQAPSAAAKPAGKAAGYVRIRGPSGEVANVRADRAAAYLSRPGYERVE